VERGVKELKHSLLVPGPPDVKSTKVGMGQFLACLFNRSEAKPPAASLRAFLLLHQADRSGAHSMCKDNPRLP